GKRHIGACVDGQQTCLGGGEFGFWGPCVGGIGPKQETCNNLDDNCNGCLDENLCCGAGGTSCPGPNDPRVPNGQPYTPVPLHGHDFFPNATEISWRVTGGPCDDLLYATTGVVTFRLNAQPVQNIDALDLVFYPLLSGDYTIEVTGTNADGTVSKCTFILLV